MKGGVKINVRAIGLKLPITGPGGELSPDKRKQIMTIMALMAINKVLDRVKRGESLGGGAFKPYTDAYRKWKASKGRAPETAGDWLTLSGQMLASFQPLMVTHDQWVAGFAGNRADGVSNALLAWVNHEKYGRLFVGLTEDEKTDIVNKTIVEATARGLLDNFAKGAGRARRR